MPFALFAVVEVLVGANRKRQRNQIALEWNGEVGVSVPHATCVMFHRGNDDTVESTCVCSPRFICRGGLVECEGL